MAGLRTRTVFSDHDLTVTAVESVELHTDRSARRFFLIGSLEPTAVIVKTPDGTYALDMAAQPVALEELELPDDFEWE